MTVSPQRKHAAWLDRRFSHDRSGHSRDKDFDDTGDLFPQERSVHVPLAWPLAQAQLEGLVIGKVEPCWVPWSKSYCRCEWQDQSVDPNFSHLDKQVQSATPG